MLKAVEHISDTFRNEAIVLLHDHMFESLHPLGASYLPIGKLVAKHQSSLIVVRNSSSCLTSDMLVTSIKLGLDKSFERATPAEDFIIKCRFQNLNTALPASRQPVSYLSISGRYSIYAYSVISIFQIGQILAYLLQICRYYLN